MDVFSPKIIKVKSLDSPVRLHATGDWHVGEAGCNETAIKNAVSKIADDPHSIVLLMGDLGGFIAPDDARWDPYSVSADLSIRDLGDWGHVLVDKIVHLATPLKGKIIGAITGNHESVYHKRKSFAVIDQIAAGLGCPSLGYSALFRLVFRSQSGDESVLSVFATHGSGGASLEGGKLNRLVKYMGVADADLVLVAHMHIGVSIRRERLVQSGESIGKIPQTGIITGSYLGTYSQSHSGYGERAGYHPSPLCHPCIEIIPRTKTISVQWITPDHATYRKD